MSKKGCSSDRLFRGKWEKDDLRELKQMFPNNPTAKVADLLGRPTEAVKKKASRLRLKKSKRYLKSLGRVAMILLALCLFAGTARADQFTLEGAFDYETAESSAMWWPDPNGGVGVMVLTDSLIPEVTEENFAIGPCVEFSLTGLTDAIWGTILPGNWVPSDAGLVESFGKLALLWEAHEGGDIIAVAATGWRFLPGKTIQPTLWTEYIRPEGSSAISTDVKVMAGVTIWLGKK